MKKEDVQVIVQLVMSIKELINKLEIAKNNNDVEGIVNAKKEIINFQKQIDGML